jgi:hypothetical protein
MVNEIKQNMYKYLNELIEDTNKQLNKIMKTMSGIKKKFNNDT